MKAEFNNSIIVYYSFEIIPKLKASQSMLFPLLLSSYSIACLSTSLVDKGMFCSANILQIADVIHQVVFLLFLLCF